MMIQTQANKYLIQRLGRELRRYVSSTTYTPRILNIGAAKTIYIEDDLSSDGCVYVADRIDVDDCTVTHPYIRQCWKCSVESMDPVNSQQYDFAIANWVLEHVSDLNNASREIYRILKPSGKLIAAVPNPAAPEFLFARLTPFWVHKIIRGQNADADETYHTYHTCYAYDSIKQLLEIFKQAGFREIEIKYFPTIESYVSRFPFLNFSGKLYDNIISSLKIKPLMGHVCVLFEKPST
ncbi:MAG TPA: SAM-dependent methyltransferase [Nitrospirae bacterium]|nr:hypothetical protein BMS3Abin06_01730 [bacterium BMS3Abin06]HDH12408.1 SAM-dependent methyltransferase [Nitrospirota bacterium]HDY99846.1 SAM-dependent methyltransferase [Nitrospirota bacterium]